MSSVRSDGLAEVNDEVKDEDKVNRVNEVNDEDEGSAEVKRLVVRGDVPTISGKLVSIEFEWRTYNPQATIDSIKNVFIQRAVACAWNNHDEKVIPLTRKAMSVWRHSGQVSFWIKIGEVDFSDGVAILNFLFGGGPPPALPGPTSRPCGPDPDASGSAGDLGCDSYTGC